MFRLDGSTGKQGALPVSVLPLLIFVKRRKSIESRYQSIQSHPKILEDIEQNLADPLASGKAKHDQRVLSGEKFGSALEDGMYVAGNIESQDIDG